MRGWNHDEGDGRRCGGTMAPWHAYGICKGESRRSVPLIRTFDLRFLKLYHLCRIYHLPFIGNTLMLVST